MSTKWFEENQKEMAEIEKTTESCEYNAETAEKLKKAIDEGLPKYEKARETALAEKADAEAIKGAIERTYDNVRKRLESAKEEYDEMVPKVEEETKELAKEYKLKPEEVPVMDVLFDAFDYDDNELEDLEPEYAEIMKEKAEHEIKKAKEIFDTHKADAGQKNLIGARCALGFAEDYYNQGAFEEAADFAMSAGEYLRARSLVIEEEKEEQATAFLKEVKHMLDDLGEEGMDHENVVAARFALVLTEGPYNQKAFGDVLRLAKCAVRNIDAYRKEIGELEEFKIIGEEPAEPESEAPKATETMEHDCQGLYESGLGKYDKLIEAANERGADIIEADTLYRESKEFAEKGDHKSAAISLGRAVRYLEDGEAKPTEPSVPEEAVDEASKEEEPVPEDEPESEETIKLRKDYESIVNTLGAEITKYKPMGVETGTAERYLYTARRCDKDKRYDEGASIARRGIMFLRQRVPKQTKTIAVEGGAVFVDATAAAAVNSGFVVATRPTHKEIDVHYNPDQEEELEELEKLIKKKTSASRWRCKELTDEQYDRLIKAEPDNTAGNLLRKLETENRIVPPDPEGWLINYKLKAELSLLVYDFMKTEAKRLKEEAEERGEDGPLMRDGRLWFDLPDEPSAGLYKSSMEDNVHGAKCEIRPMEKGHKVVTTYDPRDEEMVREVDERFRNEERVNITIPADILNEFMNREEDDMIRRFLEVKKKKGELTKRWGRNSYKLSNISHGEEAQIKPEVILRQGFVKEFGPTPVRKKVDKKERARRVEKDLKKSEMAKKELGKELRKEKLKDKAAKKKALKKPVKKAEIKTAKKKALKKPVKKDSKKPRKKKGKKSTKKKVSEK